MVTWNDRIPDPDNPKQPRQIDITVRRGNWTVHIECRFHREPQDVQWIEELHGRRDSLGADEIIAVSSSGFTDTAKLKAARFKIPLRSLCKVTDDEIHLWARKTVAKAIFYQFTNCQVVFTLGIPGVSHPISITKALSELCVGFNQGLRRGWFVELMISSPFSSHRRQPR